MELKIWVILLDNSSLEYDLWYENREIALRILRNSFHPSRRLHCVKCMHTWTVPLISNHLNDNFLDNNVKVIHSHEPWYKSNLIFFLNVKLLLCNSKSRCLKTLLMYMSGLNTSKSTLNKEHIKKKKNMLAQVIHMPNSGVNGLIWIFEKKRCNFSNCNMLSTVIVIFLYETDPIQ